MYAVAFVEGFIIVLFLFLALVTLVYDSLCAFFSSPSKRKEKEFFSKRYRHEWN